MLYLFEEIQELEKNGQAVIPEQPEHPELFLWLIANIRGHNVAFADTDTNKGDPWTQEDLKRYQSPEFDHNEFGGQEWHF